MVRIDGLKLNEELLKNKLKDMVETFDVHGKLNNDNQYGNGGLTLQFLDKRGLKGEKHTGTYTVTWDSTEDVENNTVSITLTAISNINKETEIYTLKLDREKERLLDFRVNGKRGNEIDYVDFLIECWRADCIFDMFGYKVGYVVTGYREEKRKSTITGKILDINYDIESGVNLEVVVNEKVVTSISEKYGNITFAEIPTDKELIKCSYDFCEAQNKGKCTICNSNTHIKANKETNNMKSCTECKSNYGGVVTNITELYPNTSFRVKNGEWDGCVIIATEDICRKACDDNNSEEYMDFIGKKCIYVDETKKLHLLEGDRYLELSGSWRF